MLKSFADADVGAWNKKAKANTHTHTQTHKKATTRNSRRRMADKPRNDKLPAEAMIQREAAK